MPGVRRTLFSLNGLGIIEYPVSTTGRVAPLPTMMEVGKEGEDVGVTIPGFAAMWEEAPESKTQSVLPGGVSDTVLNA